MSDPKETEHIAFSTILASTVHDIKNALGLILQTLDKVSEQVKQVDPESKEIPLLQYEAARVNTLMVQLLALYKAEQKQLPLNINYYNVYDFLEEQALSLEHLSESRNITISFDVDDDELEWAFDYDLVATVFNNIITNSIRYCRDQIKLEAMIENNELLMRISDDGDGYPEKMLKYQNNYILGINQSSGSTGLGIYFAGQVAKLHKRDSSKGEIKLSNHPDGGGVFEIRLP